MAAKLGQNIIADELRRQNRIAAELSQLGGPGVIPAANLGAPPVVPAENLGSHLGNFDPTAESKLQAALNTVGVEAKKLQAARSLVGPPSESKKTAMRTALANFQELLAINSQGRPPEFYTEWMQKVYGWLYALDDYSERIPTKGEHRQRWFASETKKVKGKRQAALDAEDEAWRQNEEESEYKERRPNRFKRKQPRQLPAALNFGEERAQDFDTLGDEYEAALATERLENYSRKRKRQAGKPTSKAKRSKYLSEEAGNDTSASTERIQHRHSNSHGTEPKKPKFINIERREQKRRESAADFMEQRAAAPSFQLALKRIKGKIARARLRKGLRQEALPPYLLGRDAVEDFINNLATTEAMQAEEEEAEKIASATREIRRKQDHAFDVARKFKLQQEKDYANAYMARQKPAFREEDNEGLNFFGIQA
jgi:hypothetical protein